MPQTFRLYSRINGDAVNMSTIDKEICDLLGCEVHPKKYCRELNWFDSIGLCIANGMSLGTKELRDYYLKDDWWCKDMKKKFKKVLDYLELNYFSDLWHYTSKK
tara:strand:+ start:3291 stop:3602 length:312 start_codon:yes stop_codon:yes gene_type:complete